MNNIKTRATSAVLTVSSCVIFAGAALTASADQVDCNKCVDTSDIAKQAVNTSRLKNGAVSSKKLKDGIIPYLTEWQILGQVTDSSVTTSWEELVVLGQFEKQNNKTDIELSVQAPASVESDSTTAFCDFQVRINGLDEDGGADTSVNNGGRAVVGDMTDKRYDGTPLIVGNFEGLPAGIHTASIWLRGIADSCTWNEGSFNTYTRIKEYLVNKAPAVSGVEPSGYGSGNQGLD